MSVIKKKPIISNTVKICQETYPPIKGYLDTFHETGMECLGLVLMDETVKGDPNPNFNPDLPEEGSNFKYFGNYDAINFIKNGDILEINGIRYAMLQDEHTAKDNGYKLSFYPIGWKLGEFLELFNGKTKAALYRRKND